MANPQSYVSKGHELGTGYPDQSWWNYCCDCATFWPAESMGESFSSLDCLICERQTAQRFVCASCRVISIESAAVVRRKSHSIEAATGIKPSCPGCGSVVTSSVTEHVCSDSGLRYLTTRPTCLLCEELIVTSTQPAGNGTGTLSCWSCQSNLTAPFNSASAVAQRRVKSRSRLLILLRNGCDCVPLLRNRSVINEKRQALGSP